MENIKIKFYKSIFDRKNDAINKEGVMVKGFDNHSLLTVNQLTDNVKSNTVNECREAYKVYKTSQLKTDKEGYSKIKNQLTAIDCHSITDHNEAWESNNLLIYDYDNLEHKEIESIIYQIENECLFYMISPSGYGIKIAYVFDSITENQFNQLYEAFGGILDTRLGFKYDVKCNDLRRLCYITHEVKCNEKYKTFNTDNYKHLFGLTKSVSKQSNIEILDTDLAETEKGAALTNTSSKVNTTKLNSDELKENYLLEYLETAYQYCVSNNITFNLNYDNWTKLLVGLIRLCYNNHVLGLKYFILFSKLCKNFSSENECKKEYQKWQSYGGIGFKTFLSFIKQHKISVDKTILSNLKSCFGLTYKDEKGTSVLRKNQVKKYLKQKFFRINESKIIYYKDGNILKQGFDFEYQQEHKYFDMLYNYFFEVLDEVELTENKKETTIDKIKDMFSMSEFKKITLENKDLKSLYKTDTKNTIYLYTLKGLITITKDITSFKAYEVDEVIDEAWIAKDEQNNTYINYDKTANWKDYKSLPFYHKFCENEKDFEYLKRIIGFVISRERSFGSNDGILFIDGLESSEKGGGGSGKSIICNNFNYLRKVFELNNPKYNNFLYGGLDNHSIVVMEDIQWVNISIRELRCFKDLKVSSESKNVNRKLIAKKDTPRIILSSNSTPDSVDNADKRRFHIFHPTSFFNIDNTVYDFLNFSVFDYNETEWSLWLSFMIECCRCYLNDGLNPVNKWDYVDMKRKNELDNSVKFNKISNFITDYITQNQNGLLDIEMKNDTLFNAVSEVSNLTAFIREYIESVAKDLGYSVEFEKCIKKNSPNFNKKVMCFSPIP